MKTYDHKCIANFFTVHSIRLLIHGKTSEWNGLLNLLMFSGQIKVYGKVIQLLMNSVISVNGNRNIR